jgi:hypothetical protein
VAVPSSVLILAVLDLFVEYMVMIQRRGQRIK